MASTEASWKECIYPLGHPQRTRSVPMQVLCVGPSRCGTDSLRAALVELGYDHTYHGYDIALNPVDDVAWNRLYRRKWHGSDHLEKGRTRQLTSEDFDEVIGHCAAITDFDAAVFATDLIAAYPDAKVILNTRRDVDAWMKSTESTILKMKGDWRMWFRSWFCSELFWIQENLLRSLWPTFYRGNFEHNAKWVLEDHCALIRGTVPAERLLEWDVQDGWEPLCKFLGKEIPKAPFPSGNTPADYAVKLDQLYRGFNRKADINIAISFACVAAFIFLLTRLCIMD